MTSELTLANGDKVSSTSELRPVTFSDGSGGLVIEVLETELVEESGEKRPDSSTFEDINPEELKRIVKNTRVDAPGGQMPLNAVLLDLAEGHNEVEQYKKGALGLQQALDERLIEEEKNNPDSKTCRVLEEAKKSAFGLYLRIERGDQELHGNREGQYEGYFD
jgi:hypothetical protein